MRFDKKSMLLYAVTDRAWVGRQTFLEQIEEALASGVTFLQLREKELPDEEFLYEARKVKELAAAYAVPFVINDNVQIALQCNADGVHVGQNDMEAGDVRKRLGKEKILGVSVQTIEQAKLAEERGADYLGVGAVFNTSTKADAAEVSYETLKDICDAVSIPVVAIGGIDCSNVHQLAGSGIEGIAVISALFSSQSIADMTRSLKKEIEAIVYNG